MNLSPPVYRRGGTGYAGLQAPAPAPAAKAAKRLTRLQRALLAHMGDQGGKHVHLGRGTKAVGHLRGYTWEGVHLSLQSLLRAGLIEKSGQNDGFWSLTA